MIGRVNTTPLAPLRWAFAPTQVVAASEFARVPAPPTGWSSVGRLHSPVLDEVSGVVASRTQPGVLWVHNDSGDSSRIFAVDERGVLRNEVKVTDSHSVDWEDISQGPGPKGAPGNWLYVADTGDNLSIRPSLSIYAFPEPDATSGSPVRALRTKVLFSDGNKYDVEAMMVDPRSGDVLLVTKSKHAAQLFRMSQPRFDGSAVTALYEATLAVGPLVTGADISGDGSQIAVRTYEGAYLWQRSAGESCADAMSRVPKRIDAPASEAIAFTPDGQSLLSIPEGKGAVISRAAVPAF